jgi:hypothetical protein
MDGLKTSDGNRNEDSMVPEVLIEVDDDMKPLCELTIADRLRTWSKLATGKMPDVSFAKRSVDATIAAADAQLFERRTNGTRRLSRALNVALSIKDPLRITAVASAIIRYEESVGSEGLASVSGSLFDLLVENDKIRLSSEQCRKLVGNMEARLSQLTDTNDASGLDPWAIESVALPLARWYRSKKQADQACRTVLKLRDACVITARAKPGIEAAAWLRMVHDVLASFGLHAEAAEATVAIREHGRPGDSELRLQSHTMSVPVAAFEEFVDGMTAGSLSNALRRIAVHFTPDPKHVERLVTTLSSEAVLYSMISVAIVDNDGRTVAQVGSVSNDLDGRVVFQMGQLIQLSGLWLRGCLERLVTRQGLTSAQLADHILATPVFLPEHHCLVRAGISAFLHADHVTALHVLTPQIEAALRSLIEKSGGSVMKAHRNGGFMMKTLDEVLRDPIVSTALSERAVLYLRVLLTDARGLNLRNKICHGLMPSSDLTHGLADRIVHALLVLSGLQEQKEQNGAV